MKFGEWHAERRKPPEESGGRGPRGPRPPTPSDVLTYPAVPQDGVTGQAVQGSWSVERRSTCDTSHTSGPMPSSTEVPWWWHLCHRRSRSMTLSSSGLALCVLRFSPSPTTSATMASADFSDPFHLVSGVVVRFDGQVWRSPRVRGYSVTCSCNSRYLNGAGFLESSGFKRLSMR